MIYDERFKLQQSAEAIYLTVTLDDDAQFDEIALHMLTEDKPDFFFPISMKEINGTLMLRYKFINAAALKYSVDRAMTKKQYLQLALALLAPFIRCRDWFLDYHYICIDPQYILRDKSTGAFLYAYLPERSMRNTDEEILTFAESILNYIDISDDKDFQIRMMHYFRDGAVTLGDLYRMFTAENDRTADARPAAGAAAASASVSAGSGQTAAAASAAQQSAVQGAQPAAQSTQPQTAAASVPADTAADKKSGILEKFGFLGGKNDAKDAKDSKDDIFGLNNTASAGGAASAVGTAPAGGTASAGGTYGGDNVMNALFGDDTKKSGGAGTKKPDDAKASRSGGFLGSLLGGNKKESAPASAAAAAPAAAPAAKSAVPSPAPAAAAVTEAPVIGSGATCIGGDETLLDAPGASAGYLELIDTQYTDCPQKIALDFNGAFIVIGRKTKDASGADVLFPEQYTGVSRQHARIIRAEDGSLHLMDLGSTYGTLLSGQRLIPNAMYRLTDGCEIVFVEAKPIRYRVHL